MDYLNSPRRTCFVPLSSLRYSMRRLRGPRSLACYHACFNCFALYVFVYWLSHIRYHSTTRTLSLEVSTNTHIDCTLNISSIRFVCTCRPILIVPSVFLLYGCVFQLGIKENNDDDYDEG